MQSQRSTPEADDTNTCITNCGALLRSRRQNRRNILTTQPLPLTPSPGWNQPMLSDTQNINTSLKNKIPICQPPAKI